MGYIVQQSPPKMIIRLPDRYFKTFFYSNEYPNAFRGAFDLVFPVRTSLSSKTGVSNAIPP